MMISETAQKLSGGQKHTHRHHWKQYHRRYAIDAQVVISKHRLIIWVTAPYLLIDPRKRRMHSARNVTIWSDEYRSKKIYITPGEVGPSAIDVYVYRVRNQRRGEGFSIRFLPTDALHKRGLCRSKMSVCPSVTGRRYCVQTAKHIIKLFSQSDNHTVLVFR